MAEMTLGDIMKLVELKVNNPDVYEAYLEAIKEVSKDMIKMTTEIMEEMQIVKMK